ncbi:ribonuclease domain-containing protein [Streptomyces sp. 549]|uniref:ribonuclease domain-containing protein n=1 Tax=Streptomyces sp. 549 TaxID=3049076 RepID=UPI0024C29D2C|nr:ribonuclease domain-containing protein [Streptomyces sp. 549]MDK1474290.1 ribonuclease domain-containing protein [Streptomyces sp. 549]
MLRKLLLACLTASVLLLTGCAPGADPGDRAPAASAPTSPGAAATPAWAEGMETVTPDRLPPEARETLRLIDEGGPYPYGKDDSVFGNFERRLPAKQRGHYREYTVRTPGARDRGARRIVAGRDGERYWTSDHYESFKAVVQP